MDLIEGNKFDIKSLENIIEQFERSIEKLKVKPKTEKRLKHIAELEQLIKYRKNKIRTLEIENELEEIKGRRNKCQICKSLKIISLEK